MRNINFECFKISTRLNLSRIASALRLQKLQSWENSIVLRGAHLDSILKTKSFAKKVFIYDFGCITFVNFKNNEIRSVLETINQIEAGIDYELFAKYHESHIIRVSKNDQVELWKGNACLQAYDEGIISIISEILAKSTALYKIETDAGLLLDETEKYIKNLQRGKLHVPAKKSMNNYSRILRFEFESLSSVRVFDRSWASEKTLLYRKTYDALTNYYEISDRFEILEKKVNELRNITKLYSALSIKHRENRLLVFEIFLLALFPVYHFTHSFLEKVLR